MNHMVKTVSLSFKLALMAFLILGLGGAGFIFIAQDFVRGKTIHRIQESDSALTETLVRELAGQISNVVEGMRDSLQWLTNNGPSPVVRDRLNQWYHSHDSVLGLKFFKYSSQQKKLQEFYAQYKSEALADLGFQASAIDKETLPVLARLDPNPDDTPFIFSSSVKNHSLIHVTFFVRNPSEDKSLWLIRADLKQEFFNKLFVKRQALDLYVVDKEGNIFAHAGDDPATRVDASKLNRDFVGAFRSIGYSEMKVVVKTSYDEVVKETNHIRYRMLLVTLGVLGLALIFLTIFANHLIRPLDDMRKASESVATGHFDVQLQVQNHDELGQLAVAFRKMIFTLQEKDKLDTIVKKSREQKTSKETKIVGPEPTLSEMIQPAEPSGAVLEEKSKNDNGLKNEDIKRETTKHHEGPSVGIASNVVHEVHLPEPYPPSPPHPTPSDDQWYLVRDPQTHVVEGPLTSSELKNLTTQVGFPLEQAYAYRQNDSHMTPVMQISGVSRRASQAMAPPPGVPLPGVHIQAHARPEEWFIYNGEGSRTHGPYTFEQLVQALEMGQITRTTYCWRQGMGEWIFLYQIPGIDRRQSGPVPPPLPKVG